MPNTTVPLRWGVFLKLAAGGRTLHRLRLVLEDVPAELSPAKVRAALEAAGYSSRFSDGGVPWANHQLLKAARWPKVIAAGGEAPTTLSWEQLQSNQVERRLTIGIDPGEYSQLELAAAHAGEKLYPWSRARLLEAAALELRTPAATSTTSTTRCTWKNGRARCSRPALEDRDRCDRHLAEAS